MLLKDMGIEKLEELSLSEKYSCLCRIPKIQPKGISGKFCMQEGVVNLSSESENSENLKYFLSLQKEQEGPCFMVMVQISWLVIASKTIKV